MASYKDHQVSFLYRQYFGWFGMVAECDLYVVPGIPQAYPLSLQSSVSPWILSMGGMLLTYEAYEARGGRGEEKRLYGGVIAMKILDVSPDSPNVTGPK